MSLAVTRRMDGPCNSIVQSGKQCNRCCLQKPLSDFSRRSSQKDGLQTRCKACVRAVYLENHSVVRARQKEYWRRNKETLIPKQREYWKETNEARLAHQREYQAANKEAIRAQQRRWAAENPKLKSEKNRKAYLKADRVARAEYAKNYNAMRRATDPMFRIKENMRSRTTDAIKRGGYTKKSSLTVSLGCDWHDLCSHLARHFSEAMTWGNYGKYWVIDHHVPLASAPDEKSLLALCHYTNLRPLEKTENLRKGASMPYVNGEM